MIKCQEGVETFRPLKAIDILGRRYFGYTLVAAHKR
jgi:hypothetical protein